MSLVQEENNPVFEHGQIDGSECEIDELKMNYQVVTLIAKGTFGKVFKVQENTCGKFLALKLIRKPEPVEEGNDEASDGKYSLLHVQREKRILENIGDHPFLVTLHDSFETCHHVGLLMNYIEGIPFAEFMSNIEEKVLPEGHAAFYTAELSLALHNLHKKGIIHRDLKNNNVMIDLDGHVKLIDYGSAIDGLSFEEKTSHFNVICSDFYIAPEIVRERPYNHQCDWYSLGVLLCGVITGKHPFFPASKQTDENEDYEITDDDILFMIEANYKMEFQFEKSIISEEAYSLLEKLLHFYLPDRMGRYDDENRMEIAECSFLKDINWARLERREVDAPIKPLVKTANQSKDTVTET